MRYTSKVPGTEDGVSEPIPTFSTCYSAPFIVLHPSRYGTMMTERMKTHNSSCWLVNTGWTGGKYGTGSRIPLEYTRTIINAIHNGDLIDSPNDNPGWSTYDVFKLRIPRVVPGVPSEILDPSRAWADEDAFERERIKLAKMFKRAFKMFEHDIAPEVRDAEPDV